MMILFQNRILYMPGIPFGSRREELPKTFNTLTWSSYALPLPHTKHTLAVATTMVGTPAPEKKHTVIVYFQGNAASAPLRVPSLSRVFKGLSTKDTYYTFLYPSYRGYWTSTGRPSFKAISEDTPEVFRHIHDTYPSARIVLWGQSIGCPIVLHGLAHEGDTFGGKKVDVVLETPFTSVVDMIPAMWPERWLPYHYLGPFVRSRWDSVAAFEKARDRVGRMLVLRAEKDEIVPEAVGRKIEEEAERMLGGGEEEGGGQGQAQGMSRGTRKGRYRGVVVKGALHTMVLEKQQGVEEVRGFLEGR